MSDGRQHYRNAISQFEPLNREEVKALYELIDEGSEFEQRWAREKMIQHNLRLVVKVASRYRLDDAMMEDVIQEGNQGLMRAVDKFDPSLGNAFSTYAVNWIHYRIDHYIREHFHVVKIPVDLQKANSKVVKAKRLLSHSGGEADVTSAQLADHLGMSIEEVETSLSLVQSKVYLDASLSSDDSSSNHYEYYGDSVDHETQLENSIAMDQVVSRINELPAQQRDMICRRYGIGCPEENLREIGDSYQLCRERVRQIIEIGKKKLMTMVADEQVRQAI